MAIRYTFTDVKRESIVQVNQIDDIISVWASDGIINGDRVNIHLDIATAIKLSKTLRTEINKAKEVNNG